MLPNGAVVNTEHGQLPFSNEINLLQANEDHGYPYYDGNTCFIIPDPWHSLFAETTILLPAAAVILAIIAARGESTYGAGSGHTVLLTLAGVVTAVPLLLFAAAAQRVPLVTIGLIQFITPVMQLLVGVLILKEHVTPALWLGFGIVWVALIILTIDSLRAAHRNRGTLPPLDPGAA